MTATLVKDPTSHTCAAMNGWEYPFSRETQALASLFDLTMVVNTDKNKRNQIDPYPRPWRAKDEERSKAPTVSQKTIREALARTRENTQHGD